MTPAIELDFCESDEIDICKSYYWLGREFCPASRRFKTSNRNGEWTICNFATLSIVIINQILLFPLARISQVIVSSRLALIEGIIMIALAAARFGSHWAMDIRPNWLAVRGNSDFISLHFFLGKNENEGKLYRSNGPLIIVKSMIYSNRRLITCFLSFLFLPFSGRYQYRCRSFARSIDHSNPLCSVEQSGNIPRARNTFDVFE